MFLSVKIWWLKNVIEPQSVDFAEQKIDPLVEVSIEYYKNWQIREEIHTIIVNENYKRNS